MAEAQLEYDETKEDKQMEYEEQLKKVALKLLSQSFDIASFSYSYFKLQCDLDRLRCQSIHSCVRMSDMTGSASEHRFSFNCVEIEILPSLVCKLSFRLISWLLHNISH